MGSTAFTNTPRVGLAMAYDDDPDVRVVEVIKSNIGPRASAEPPYLDSRIARLPYTAPRRAVAGGDRP